MNIGWPEGIYIVLSFGGLGMSLARRGAGEPPIEMTPGLQALAMVMSFTLLWWGGFFA